MDIIFQFFTFPFFFVTLQPKITKNDNETYEKGGSHDARHTDNRLM